jgi:SRSO17 transposase
MDLEFDVDTDGQHRIAEYFERIGGVLNNKKRRASFAIYAHGLLADGDRKSVEPIAARACGDPGETDTLAQRLGHFLVDSAWDDCAVRREAAQYAVAALIEREPIQNWIIDDTGWLKQGTHSVGVQRQYTGSAGKVTNCQVGVSLTLTTATEHVPVDFALYLPKTWTDSRQRRLEARIPDDVTFKTKPELALDLIDRALEANLPRGLVLVDTAYGNSSEFREQLRQRALDYAVAVEPTTKVWLTDSRERRRGDALSVRDLGRRIAGRRRGFRRTTWRAGTKTMLSARFAACRVVSFHDDGWDPTERDVLWLLIEWEDGQPAPTKYYLATLPPTMTRKQLVRRVKQRWRTERVYEDLKNELGLDHYEGRRYPGWHHHVSAVLSCYAFLVAERVRRFPPSARGIQEDYPLSLAA